MQMPSFRLASARSRICTAASAALRLDTSRWTATKLATAPAASRMGVMDTCDQKGVPSAR